MHHHLTRSEWVAIAAHRLHCRWRSTSPRELEEVAHELWNDQRLASLDPDAAVTQWLAPVTPPPTSN